MMACRGDRKPLRLIGARLRSGVTPQHQKQKPDGIKTNNDGVSIPDKAASWEGVRLHHSSRFAKYCQKSSPKSMDILHISSLDWLPG